jgi:subtilisin family serine protease
MNRWSIVAGLALAVVACKDGPTAPPASPSADRSAVRAPQAAARYIIRFRDDVQDVSGHADQLTANHHGRLTFTYQSAIKGFAGEFSDQDIAALARDPNVLAIEPDQIAHALTVQTNPPSWGLDRIDQRALPLNNSYTYNATGAGVTVYIIDTGIWFTHNDFGGRAVTGEDEITPGGTATDCNGHGTHVAGTVGGSSYGVAKSVKLVAVRVLDCSGSGSYSQVIAGVDYVTRQKQANPSVPAAANMSLGGSTSAALNQAVTNSIAAGVTYAIAAGNSSADACTQSPASTPNAITVAATDINDARASFSNFGTCVDIFAPGVNITSAWNTNNTATNTISGTSMASPHVAGAAALYLQGNPSASAAAVTSALTTNATTNVVTSPGAGSPNLLLYTGFITAGPPPPPVANFTYSCTGLSCSFNGSSSSAQPGATYTWAWGDATANGSGVTASHSYAAAGTYNVTLTVTDVGGTNAKTQAVTVTTSTVPPPVANFTFSCTGLTCSFNGNSSTAQANATFTWSWGDGTANGTGRTPTHTYATAGTKSVTLTVTDAGGTSTKTQAVTVTSCVNGQGEC